MKYFKILALSLYLLVCSSAHAGDFCDEDAYYFGQSIKTLVKKKDLAGLFNLVEGELERGPRKASIEGKSFDEVFSAKWQREVLAADSPCEIFSPSKPFFQMASGKIWYYETDTSYAIFAIAGANKIEANAPANVAWLHHGQVIPAGCFVVEWLSSDNYKAYTRQYGIKLAAFRGNPGRFMGVPINLSQPVEAYGDSYVIASDVQQCLSGRIHAGRIYSTPRQIVTEVDQANSRVTSRKVVEDWFEDGMWYRLAAPVSVASCQALAPHVKGTCVRAYLVQVAIETGGSMGDYLNNVIFGLFKMRDGREMVMPLKSFDSKNAGLNFIRR